MKLYHPLTAKLRPVLMFSQNDKVDTIIVEFLREAAHILANEVSPTTYSKRAKWVDSTLGLQDEKEPEKLPYWECKKHGNAGYAIEGCCMFSKYWWCSHQPLSNETDCKWNYCPVCAAPRPV